MKICLSCEGVSNTPASRCGHCGAWLVPTDAVHYPERTGEADAGNPLLGTVVDGKYRLLGVLGRGGLGTVFRAQHVGSLLHVALKLLHPRFAERPEYRSALLPEARRAAAVTHEHCARLLDVGEAADGVAYLAMELVGGRTLDLLVRAGPLAPSHAVDVLVQVADALAAIHGAGLVHCDLSPRNVMVEGHHGALRVKVLDFGIARSVSQAGPPQPRGEFAGFVNPAFSAPELLAGGDVGPRADLWSFGVLAWLLLTGTMPVDDTDARAAAAAVRDGRLRPWPATARVGRRLVRLVRACLQLDPAARPVSAAALRRELQVVARARQPLLARSGIAVGALGVVAVLAGSPGDVAPFLEPLAGTALRLTAGAATALDVQDVPGERLAALVFSHGGFAPNRLRANLVRDGRALDGASLQPIVDVAAGTLTVGDADPAWRRLRAALAAASRDGPVDLTFVVPGAATLGAARLRVDDTPPTLAVELRDAAAGLQAATVVRHHVADDVAVTGFAAEVSFVGGRTLSLPLPLADGDFPLGRELARATGVFGALGEGELRFVAVDRAGNRATHGPVRFPAADVAVPVVVDVTGPLGEDFVPLLGGRAHLRVRLSAAEPGCTLVVRCGAVVTPPCALAGTADSHPVELDVGAEAAGVRWQFAVTDLAGNRSESELPVRVRDRSTAVAFRAPQQARWRDGELVVGGDAAVVAAVGANWTIVGVRLDADDPASGAGPADAVSWQSLEPAAVQLRFHDLGPGSHRLTLQLHEGGDGDRGLPGSASVAVRALPPAIEVQVPAGRSRFLPGMVDAGVLAVLPGGGLVDGPGWRLDPALRPYVRGTLWRGATDAVGVPVPAGTGPLLPPTVPLRGRNRLAVTLVDVLDRPVHVVVAGGDAVAAAAPVVVADFHWHDGPPQLVGEELVVEHGQPMRVRVRYPLPFTAADAPAAFLRIAESRVAASAVAADGDDAVVLVFDVPFTVWSVAAQWIDRTREQFAAGLQQQVGATVLTPAGDAPLVLPLRTTRSTLAPLALRELRELPPALGALRFLPVLAPPGPFAEPVPATAPPRSLFRPQAAVAVRNMGDVLLQDREFACGEARALGAAAAALPAPELLRCVHHDDPLGAARLGGSNLLPAAIAAAPDDATLTGVTFFQAWALSRLLGLVVAGDPAVFRLPLGCELELAAFGGAPRSACHGVAAHGGSVAMAHFLAAEGAPGPGGWPTAGRSRAAGDVVPTPFGEPFVGLDFGVREWVLDLPSIAGADAVLREWTADRDGHVARVLALADGSADPTPDPVGPLRHFAVVRGLALGERLGLLGGRGERLEPARLRTVPDSVPGVLRTEQMRRDGQDLLAGGQDARLALVGFRLVALPERLAAVRGRR